MATLQNKSGQFVAPTSETRTAATALPCDAGIDALSGATTNPVGREAYPIVTYSWLLLYRSHPADRARVGFGKTAVSNL
ncbi:hypothetical protein [Methylocella silvestris]|uniref:Uncharacterized protein n=1 Tax=Methylocella silvestris TaxID=199596 RepID=A0A2J7TFW0_METSI|nr:hypothetical protein [Methylocella silvestris]PNG25665.1 hypothetical protein CR492_12115 [Methylocella silvestris]